MGIVSRTSSGNQQHEEIVWINGNGVTPRCGAGRRLVIADVGRKWVRLRPAAKPHKHPDRISIRTYASILIGGAAMLLLALVQPAAAKPRAPQLDPFARVSAYGDLTFGEGVVSTERYGKDSGTYRVEFDRSVIRCVIVAQTWSTAPGDEVVARILTPDVRAVYVYTTRNGEPIDNTFELILRCARGKS